jgi:endonuclease/exonuclease/phosphatase family metal-dependent hydrolase
MTHSLVTGQSLRTGEFLTATDSSCFLIMQRDGNLCLYSGSDPGHRGQHLWSSLAKSEPAGDYFAIMQSDGNFAVYHGTPEHQGKFVWGNYALAGGGQFVAAVEPGGNFTTSIGTATNPSRLLWAARHRLRVLTYNTHLIEGSNIEAGAWWADKKPVVFHDDPRHAQIIRKILDSGADVVAIEEVWSSDRMDRFKNDLHSVYPHYIRGTTGPATKAGSGIILVSKHPITDWNFVEFKDPQGSEDKWASKGLLWATIEVGFTNMRVGMTHAWTDAGGAECTNIQNLIQETLNGSGSSMPGVLMGDFNIHRMGNITKYTKLNQLMSDAGATDSWITVHSPDASAASATDDQVDNTLAQFFSPDRDTPAPDCIDYIYLRHTATQTLRPISAEVLRTWKESTGDRNPKWYWVHHGTVRGQPSGTVFGDKMCVVVRGTDAKLMVAVFNKTDRRWVHRTINHDNADVTTDGSPGLVWFNNRLHLFFQQGGQVYKMESEDGLTWTRKDSQGPGFRTSAGVAPVLFRNTLYVFVRDPTGAAVYYHVWSNQWSDARRIHINSKRDIAAAVLDNTLCVVSQDNSPGRTGGVMRAVLDASDQWSCGHIGDTVTSGSPGITVHDRQFKVFYREKDGGGIFACASPNGKDSWVGLPFTYHATTDEVCPMTWEGKVMLFFSFVHKAHLIYPQRALAHAYYPAQVDLDMSDHYPYQVDFVWTPKA